MRVTLHIDDAAALTPAEVAANERYQAQLAREERARRDAIAHRYYQTLGEWRAVSIAAALAVAKEVIK